MTRLRHVACAFALLVAAQCNVAQAGPGDVYVPAHLTKDGSFVPANVPPSSGGTHAAQRPRHGSTATPHAFRGARLPPVLADAAPIRK